MRSLRLLAVITVLIAVVLVVATTTHHSKKEHSTTCGVYRNDKTVAINGVRFQTELVKTAKELQQGLGGRPCIESNEAMLFVFDHPDHYAFWMKDMHFPIDILWIDANYKVVRQEIDVRPSTYPDRFVNKDHPAQYVLEVQANRSRALKVEIGTPVTF